MRRFPFLQLDVFTERAFGGNPLAVFPEAEGLTGAEMQQIAREMNLSETVFVLPAQDERALRRLRIFTPTIELPFAGHPVVGTWFALAHKDFGKVVAPPAGGSGRVEIMHELGAGTLPVAIEFADGLPRRVVMTQGAYAAGADAREREEIARSLGLRAEDLDSTLPVHTISTGVTVLAVPLRALDALSRCDVESSRLVQAYTRHAAIGLYAFTRETKDGAPSAAHARMFAPDSGIIEDPATGSAAGALGAYLTYHDALDTESSNGSRSFVIEQGDFIKRRSRIAVEVTGVVGDVREVRVAGASVIVATGELMF